MLLKSLPSESSVIETGWWRFDTCTARPTWRLIFWLNKVICFPSGFIFFLFRIVI
ncbi:hypothetical protein LINPERHAP1_LOCUS5115 [Linum perenne]